MKEIYLNEIESAIDLTTKVRVKMFDLWLDIILKELENNSPKFKVISQTLFKEKINIYLLNKIDIDKFNYPNTEKIPNKYILKLESSMGEIRKEIIMEYNDQSNHQINVDLKDFANSFYATSALYNVISAKESISNLRKEIMKKRFNLKYFFSVFFIISFYEALRQLTIYLYFNYFC